MRQITETYQYVHNNPFKTVFFGHGVVKRFNKHLDPHLFEFLYQMHLVGLHKPLADVYADYEDEAKALEARQDAIWRAKKRNTEQYMELVGRGQKDLVKAKQTLLVKMLWQLVVENQHYLEEASGKVLKQSLNRYAREQALACRIEVLKKQDMYDGDGERSQHTIYEFRDKSGYSTDETKQKSKERSRKKWFRGIATAIAITVGIGEALVAVMFAGLPLVMGAILIGIPAFLVNYYLLDGAAFGTIKEVFLGRFFKNQYGEDISLGKKIAICSASGFVLAAGLCYGVLSFGSALSGVGGLVFGLTAAASMAAPPVALVVLAAVVATVTAVAITTLFYVSVADFIKNDRAQQIGRYYKKVWHGLEGKSVLEKVGRCAWEIGKALFVVGLTALVTVCSFGKFHAKTLSILTGFFHSPSHTASRVGYYVSALAGPVNSFFAACSMNACRQLIGNVVANISSSVAKGAKRLTMHYRQSNQTIAKHWKAGHYARVVKKVVWEAAKVLGVVVVAPAIVIAVVHTVRSAYRSIKGFIKKKPSDRLVTYARVKAGAKMSVLAVSAGANAQAQAEGMSVHTGIGSPSMQAIMSHAYFPGLAINSGVPNYMACQEVCSDPVHRQMVPEDTGAEDRSVQKQRDHLETLMAQRDRLVAASPVTVTSTEAGASSGSESDDSDATKPLLNESDRLSRKIDEALTKISRTEASVRHDLGLFSDRAAADTADPVVAPSSPWKSGVALFGSIKQLSTEKDDIPYTAASAAA